MSDKTNITELGAFFPAVAVVRGPVVVRTTYRQAIVKDGKLVGRVVRARGAYNLEYRSGAFTGGLKSLAVVRGVLAQRGEEYLPRYEASPC